MREMTKEKRKEIEAEVRQILQLSVGDDYVRDVLEHESEETGSTFLNDVIEDVMETSAWDDEGYYNEEDIRLSIGRTLMARLGIEE